MLDDHPRTQTFVRAIRDVVRPGDVVVDIGTGSGVLAIAAARAGARHVYAIEGGSIAMAAREIVAANGLAERITVIEGRSTAVTLPERADVLVSETIGNDPFDEGILDTVRDARLRLLRPGARLVPASVAARVAPVDVPETFLAPRTVLSSSVERWRTAYAIDFGPLETYARRASQRMPVLLHEARSWRRVGDPVTLVEQQLVRFEGEAVEAHADVSLSAPAEHLGLLCTFDALIAPGYPLSTAQPQDPSTCSWQGLVAYVATRGPVPAGAVVRVTYSCVNGSPEFQASVS
jgi:hypothetical protein